MARLFPAFLRFFVISTCLLVSAVSFCADDVPANGIVRKFRIDNRLIIGEKVVTNVTIFYDGLVYDFIGDHGQITIYDKAAGAFTLLDPFSRLKAEVTTEKLADDFEKRKEAFRKSDNPFLEYLAAPFFEETAYEETSGLMFFRSPWGEYRFETVPLNDPVVSEAYYDYCRQLTLLNIRAGGSPSPMIRNEINPVLEQYQRFPGKVNMTLYPQGKVIHFLRNAIRAESTHTFVRRLQSPDEARIKQANLSRELFREVPLDVYIREVNK